MPDLPDHLRRAVEGAMQTALQRPVSILHSSPVHGGCIHHGCHLRTTAGDFFLKYNSLDERANFQAEIRGLQLLATQNALPTPAPLCCAATAPDEPAEALAFLVMEFLPQGRKAPGFWAEFGQGLAELHRITAPNYGLDHDNFIGRLPQANTPSPHWLDFFVHQRLEPQLVLAERNGLANTALRRSFEQLYPRLADLLPDAPPSLLHGDLWSGNFLVMARGKPALIDPAVYYGHREAEIAFTQLFGGFTPEFYAAYQEAWPLSPGWESRTSLFNLYPLTVHLNLFGRSYLPEIQATLRKFT